MKSKKIDFASLLIIYILEHSLLYHLIRLNLSFRLINNGTVFFSHHKTALTGLSAAETIQQTRCIISGAALA
jgi:hypothetical protein